MGTTSGTRPFAIVTGASAGIGYELAKLCAQNGYDLLVAADQSKIREAADDFRRLAEGHDARVQPMHPRPPRDEVEPASGWNAQGVGHGLTRSGS